MFRRCSSTPNGQPHPMIERSTLIRRHNNASTRILTAPPHVRELLAGDSSGHDWWHIARVRATALAIGRASGPTVTSSNWRPCCTTWPIGSFTAATTRPDRAWPRDGWPAWRRRSHDRPRVRDHCQHVVQRGRSGHADAHARRPRRAGRRPAGRDRRHRHRPHVCLWRPRRAADARSRTTGHACTPRLPTTSSSGPRRSITFTRSCCCSRIA